MSNCGSAIVAQSAVRPERVPTSTMAPKVRASIMKRPSVRRHVVALPPETPHQCVIDYNTSPRGDGPVRVGSDCSGGCTEHFASAVALGDVPHIQVFSSEICRSVRKFIMRYVVPLHLHPDITKRENPPGDLDLYVAGPPCQPFSSAGLMQGMEDAHGRGTIMQHVLEYISTKRPKSFLLENVSGLVTNFSSTFILVVGFLRDLRAAGGQLEYEVHWKILNTNVEGGVPQNRPRVYIVGLQRSEMRSPFTWPGPARTPKTLHEILDPHVGSYEDIANQPRTKAKNIMDVLAKMVEAGEHPEHQQVIIDAGGSMPQFMRDMCPCLTKTRVADLAFFSTSRVRLLTLADMMRLQGADPNQFSGWEETMSPRQMGAMIGNAMSQCVLERVLRRIYVSLGVQATKDPQD